MSCLNYARDRLGLAEIWAITVEENIQSIGLLKKLGFRFLKHTVNPDEETLEVHSRFWAEALLFKDLEKRTMTSWHARFGLNTHCCSGAFCAGADDFNDSVDAIFAQIDAATDPGCSVGVLAGGELIHRSGYGLANLELDVPLDGTQVHRIGSVSKQFTAFAVLLLGRRG